MMYTMSRVNAVEKMFNFIKKITSFEILAQAILELTNLPFL